MNKTLTFAVIAAVVIGTSPVLAQSRTHNGQNASTQIGESYTPSGGATYTPQYVPGFGNVDSAGFSQW